MKNEIPVQKEIINFLKNNGVLCWRVNNMGVPDPRVRGGWRKQTGYSMPGMSDIIGVVDGKFLAIEVKAPGRKNNVSEAQKAFLSQVNEHQGIGFVASSVEDVIIHLKDIIKFAIKKEG